MSKEKPEPKDESTKTVKSAAPAPVPVPVENQIKVIVDGVENIYPANSNTEAWAMHNDKHKTQHTVKQKLPKFELVK